MNHAFAGIAGGTAQTLFGPGIEISDRVDDPPAKLAIDWPRTKTAMLLQRTGRKTEVDSSVGGSQEAGGNGGRSGIHGKAPAIGNGSGGLSLVFESFGVACTRPGSDSLRLATMVTRDQKPGSAVQQEVAVAVSYKTASRGD